MARTGLPRWLAYFHFLHVSLLLAAIIFGFTYAAFYGHDGVRALFHNAFDVDSGIRIGLLPFAHFLSASAIELAARLVTLYGPRASSSTRSTVRPMFAALERATKPTKVLTKQRVL
jgi:hypothetical protein